MNSSDFRRLLERASGLHQRGQLAEAEELYRRVLASRPRQFEAQHLLGVLRAQQGRYAEALSLVGAAVEMNPGSVGALADYGLILHKLGRQAEALAQLDRALALKPEYPAALNNRGNVLSELGRFDEALASYDRALAIRPDHLDALNNRGNALMALERHDEALASYDKVLSLQPDHVHALGNRGNALAALGRHDEALLSYARAVAIWPQHADALYGRGNVLAQLKRYDEALASYDRVLAANPDHAEALDNRGNVLLQLRRYEAALASYERALAIKPDYAGALNNRGTALKYLKRYDEAIASYDRALAIKPDFADALYNRGNALKEVKRYEEAVAAYEQARAIDPRHLDAYGLIDAVAAVCDWPRGARVAAELPRQIATGNPSVTPFAFLAYSDDPLLQLQCAKNYANDIAMGLLPAPGRRPGIRRDKVRVAYLSANFRRHPMSYLMASMFELHDRNRFEVTGLSYGQDDGSDIRERVVRAFDRFVDVRTQSDDEVARLIGDREVDILVELQGFTQDGRPGIVLRRPAPIQVSYLGFPGTLGTDAIDYVIADATVLPPEQERFYAEKVARLPDTYYVTDSLAPVPGPPPSRSAAGLPERGFVFCCFNNNYKINAVIFDVWMRLLQSVDGSVLWLLRDNPAAERNLRSEAQARSVDPRRLVFAGRVDPRAHLARHRLADLFLDTLPCNAHTTATDALWAGLPVLTCPGQSFAARVAASVLYAIGLPELVTQNLAEYEARARRLATDRSELSALREKLACNRQTYPLFDTPRFCRHMEAAYMTMWERCLRGEPPESFSVPPIAMPAAQ